MAPEPRNRSVRDRFLRAFSAERFYLRKPRARRLTRQPPDYKYFTPESLRGKRYAARTSSSRLRSRPIRLASVVRAAG